MGRLGGSTLFGGPDIKDFFDPLLGLGELVKPTIHDEPEQLKTALTAAATSHSIAFDNNPAAGSLVIFANRVAGNTFADITITAPTSDKILHMGDTIRGGNEVSIFAAIADGSADYKTWSLTCLNGNGNFWLAEWKTDAKWAALVNVLDREFDEQSAAAGTTATFGPSSPLRTPNELCVAVVGTGSDMGNALGWSGGFRSPGYNEQPAPPLWPNFRVSTKITTVDDAPAATNNWTTSRQYCDMMVTFREQYPSSNPPARRVPRQLMRSR